MNKKIYQIKISLNGSKPNIWRRILISPDVKLSDFHQIIQTTMGWENSHLHQFIKDNTFYTVRMADDDFWNELNNVDYKNMKISDLLAKEKERILYEYDFGDGWMHTIFLEKILFSDDKIKYPVCTDGEMGCPPEDCGGIWGYSDMLEIVRDPEHGEYENYIEWLGEEFNPEYFDKNEVNNLLA